MGRRTTQIGLVALAISGAYVLSAIAQDFLPLDRLLKKPPDQLEPSYPFTRCAAYYKSMADYIGTKNLTDDVVANSHQASVLNAMAATKIRASRDAGSPNDYVDQVMNDVNRIANIYDSRMRQNYATSGQAFAGDQLFRNDAATCKQLTEAISQK
jgi:hypothetical protein